MRTFPRILLAAVAVACAATARAVRYEKVVDFSDPEVFEVLKNCAKGKVARTRPISFTLDPEEKCAKVSFRDLDWFGMRLPALIDHLKTKVEPSRHVQLYLKYRAVDYAGTSSFRALTRHDGKEYAHQGTLPVFENHDVAIATMSLELCWHRDGVAFDPREVFALNLQFTGGGDLSLYEAGLYEDDVVERAPIDPTPWPPEAFRVYPEPKAFQVGNGFFELGKSLRGDLSAVPPAARRGFEQELADFYGVRFDAAAPSPCGEIVFRRGPVDGVKGDGFAIEATVDRIVAESPTSSGLAYAAQTLQELIWRAGGRRLPCFRLADSPRLDNRYVLDYTWGGQDNLVYEPDFYNDVCARFVFPARYNLFSHDVASRCRWETEGAPVRSWSWTWSKDDFAKVIDFANGYGVTVVPTTQSFGHQRPYFGLNDDFAKRYCEDGDRYVMCTRNPDTLRCLFGIWDEICALCSRNPAYRSPFFMMLGDEVSWATDDVPPERRCRRCAGVPKKAIFAEHVRRLRDEANARGYRLAMYDDMFNPFHNGSNRFKCAEVRDEVPADVIRVSWGGIAYPAIAEYARKGYDAWKLTTGAQSCVVGDDRAKGLGIGLTTHEWWRGFVSPCRPQGRYSILGVRLMGGYAWGDPPHRNDELIVAAKKYGGFLMRGWSRKPLFGVERRIDGCGAVVSNAAVRLAVVPGKARGLVFTHALDLAGEQREIVRYLRENGAKRLDCRGTRVVKAVATYADGSTVEIPMFFGWNLGQYASDGSRLDDVFSRYLADTRRVVVDADDRHVRHEYEWVNPHPEKEIAALEIVPTIDRPVGVYRLFGLASKTDF